MPESNKPIGLCQSHRGDKACLIETVSQSNNTVSITYRKGIIECRDEYSCLDSNTEYFPFMEDGYHHLLTGDGMIIEPTRMERNVIEFSKR